MMRVLMVVLAMSAHLCLAELSPEAKLEMIRHDLDTLGEFKYGYYLHVENITCQYVRDMSENEDWSKLLEKNIRLLLDPFYDRYYLVKNSVRGTEAEHCLSGLAERWDQLSKQETEGMDKCIDKALMGQSQIEDSLRKGIKKYNEGKDNVLVGIETCFNQFRNNKSKYSLKNCHTILYNRFIKENNAEMIKYIDSPCMKNFLSSHLQECFLTRVNKVRDTAVDLIGKVDSCITIAELGLPKVQVNLASTDIVPRIVNIQKIYKQINDTVRSALINFYQMEKKVLETYVFSPGFKLEEDSIYDEFVKKLSDYFKAVNQTMAENPSHPHYNCGLKADERLKELICRGREIITACENEGFMVIDEGIKYVRNLFSQVMQGFPQVSNFAILDCLRDAYMFGNNTIEQCYDLDRRSFLLKWNFALEDAREANRTVVEGVGAACERDWRRGLRDELLLEADRALYDCRLCLAEATASKPGPGPTDYAVTLPAHPSWLAGGNVNRTGRD